MKKKVKFMAIFIIALFTSFISFSGDILTFETYSKNIEENIANGTMSFIENRQCLVTLWKKAALYCTQNLGHKIGGAVQCSLLRKLLSYQNIHFIRDRCT